MQQSQAQRQVRQRTPISDSDQPPSGTPNPHLVQYSDEKGYRWTHDLLTGERSRIYTGVPGDPNATFTVLTETTETPREWLVDDGNLMVSRFGIVTTRGRAQSTPFWEAPLLTTTTRQRNRYWPRSR